MHVHLLTGLVAQQGGADGGFVGDLALAGVGLGGAHDLIGGLEAVLGVAHGHGGADVHAAGGHGALVDDVHVLQLVLQHGDVVFVLRLLVLGGVIFRILAQIAETPGDLQHLGDLQAALALQIIQLLPALFHFPFSQPNLCHVLYLLVYGPHETRPLIHTIILIALVPVKQ